MYAFLKINISYLQNVLNSIDSTPINYTICIKMQTEHLLKLYKYECNTPRLSSKSVPSTGTFSRHFILINDTTF